MSVVLLALSHLVPVTRFNGTGGNGKASGGSSRFYPVAERVRRQHQMADCTEVTRVGKTGDMKPEMIVPGCGGCKFEKGGVFVVGNLGSIGPRSVGRGSAGWGTVSGDGGPLKASGLQEWFRGNAAPFQLLNNNSRPKRRCQRHPLQRVFPQIHQNENICLFCWR